MIIINLADLYKSILILSISDVRLIGSITYKYFFISRKNIHLIVLFFKNVDGYFPHKFFFIVSDQLKLLTIGKMACSGTMLVVLLLAALHLVPWERWLHLSTAAMKSSGSGRLGAACKHTLAIPIADLCLRLKPIATVPCSLGGILMGITSVLHPHQTEFKKRGEAFNRHRKLAATPTYCPKTILHSLWWWLLMHAHRLSCSEATRTWINVVEAWWCFLDWHFQTFFFFCVFFGLFGYNWSFACLLVVQ